MVQVRFSKANYLNTQQLQYLVSVKLFIHLSYQIISLSGRLWLRLQFVDFQLKRRNMRSFSMSRSEGCERFIPFRRLGQRLTFRASSFERRVTSDLAELSS